MWRPFSLPLRLILKSQLSNGLIQTSGPKVRRLRVVERGDFLDAGADGLSVFFVEEDEIDGAQSHPSFALPNLKLDGQGTNACGDGLTGRAVNALNDLVLSELKPDVAPASFGSFPQCSCSAQDNETELKRYQCCESPDRSSHRERSTTPIASSAASIPERLLPVSALIASKRTRSDFFSSPWQSFQGRPCNPITRT